MSLPDKGYVKFFFLFCTLVIASACAEPEPVAVTRAIVVTREVIVTRIVTLEPVAACGQLGCADSLRINLTGFVPDDFVLEAVAANGQSKIARCRGEELVMSGESESNPVAAPTCGPGRVTLPSFAPGEVTLTLRWGENREITGTFRPTYADFRPNGPGCEPVCRSGEITLDVE